MEEAFLHCHRQWFPRLILMNNRDRRLPWLIFIVILLAMFCCIAVMSAAYLMPKIAGGVGRAPILG